MILDPSMEHGVVLAATKPTTAFVPLLAPQRTGLALHTRF